MKINIKSIVCAGVTLIKWPLLLIEIWITLWFEIAERCKLSFNGFGQWQVWALQTFDQWHHALCIWVASGCRLKNVKNEFLVDLCRKVCGNFFKINMYDDLHVDKSWVGNQTDDVIRLDVTIKMTISFENVWKKI